MYRVTAYYHSSEPSFFTILMMVYHILNNLLYGRSIRTLCFGDTIRSFLVFSEDVYGSCPRNVFLFLTQDE
jgi:hypothetical protein